MKALKIEIDTNTIRFLQEGKVITGTFKELFNAKTRSLYFSIFPGLGIGGRFLKKTLLEEYKEYSIAIKSFKKSDFRFLGILKDVSYRNIHSFIKKYRIKTKHIYITPFTLHKFALPSLHQHLVVYKADTMIHIQSFHDGLPIFATSFLSFSQLDEFISEFYEDGNATLTFLSNRALSYTSKVEFKKIERRIKEGILLDADAY